MRRAVVTLAVLLAAASPCLADFPSDTHRPCGFGVDAVDLLWRRTSTGGRFDGNGTIATRAMMHDAVASGFTYARVAGSPFWPVDFKQSQDNSSFWPVVESVAADAEQAGLSLLVTVLWNHWAVPDVCGEPMSAMMHDRDSCSWNTLVNYTTTLIDVMGRSSAVVAWELSNELNLEADLNMTGRTSGCAPHLGTPAQRTRADNFSTTDMIQFMDDWAAVVRHQDPHGRPISTGHSIPRPEAYHLKESYHSPQRDWSHDTVEQFGTMLRSTSAMADFASVHIYAHAVRWNLSSASELVPIAADALRGTKQQLYVGEYGEERNATNNDRVFTHAMIDAIAAKKVTMSTLWVWEMKGQADTFAVYPSKDAELISAMQKANATLSCS